MKAEEVKQIISETSLSLSGNYLTHRDEVYNKTARNQPAYISLIFPLIGVLYVASKKGFFDGNYNVVEYIFNCLSLLILFLPAVFYLYKHIIRILSELFVEELFFLINKPKYAVFNSECCVSLSNENIQKIENKLLEKYNVTIKILESGKPVKRAINNALQYIREDKIVKENAIVFENNCVYGFFRNLTGGMILNIIILFTIKVMGWYNKYIGDYISTILVILFILLLVFSIMAWYAQFKHIKRESIVFFVN